MLYNEQSLLRLEDRPFEKYHKLYLRSLNESKEKLACEYFYRRTGKFLELDNPHTYNEKLQWLKLYWRDELATQFTDKLEAKQLAQSFVKNLNIIPTLASYDSASDIDWSKLPKEFVMKATHGSGFNLYINNKSQVDGERVKSVFKHILKVHYGSQKLEWNYDNIRPRILVEPLYPHSNEAPIDYKFYCFHGHVKFVEILNSCEWHYRCEPKALIVDRDYRRLDFSMSFKNELVVPKSPAFYEMIQIAEIIAKPFPHVRVDLYNFDNNIFWGECTFFPDAGYGNFSPPEKDREIGDLIKLPIITITS